MKKNFILFKQIIKEIIYVLDPKQRVRLLLVLLTVILSSAFELLGVTAILPFVQAIVAPEQLWGEKYISWFCDLFDITDHTSLLISIGIIIIFLYLIKNAFLIFATYFQTDFLTSMQKRLSVKMLDSYLSRPYVYFLDTNSSIVRTGCLTSIVSFRDTISNILTLITEVLTTILIGIYLMRTDLFTALGSLFLMGIILVGMIYLFKPAIKKTGIIAKETDFERNKSISQAVEGIKDILVTGRKGYFVRSFESAADRARIGTRTYTVLSSCPNRITEGVCVGGIIGIVCVRLATGGDSMALFIPKLASFAMAAFKVLPSVGKIANSITTIVYYRPLASLVYENVREAEDYKANYECSKLTDLRNPKSANAVLDELKQSDYTLHLENIEWKYAKQSKPVLKDMSLSIRKGESIGLIGPSGSGKSTTVDIILGLLKPQKGTISISGYDICSIPDVWPRFIGYVPQTIYLIDDTIRANIAFGLDDVSDEKIWQALERASLKGFVESLSNGLDTIVGERGVKFSGGQRQRVAIARALYQEPQLLVLDEATAALDNETEEAVIESIEALQGTITLIIVAHRLTTIRKCDRVYEIMNGVAKERETRDVV